ncbi:MAG: helix-turn-helix domain-containing protein, partial [Acidimicrobiia bacterium]
MEALAGQELLDLHGAARRLGLSRVWVNVMVLQGRLPAQRIGQQWVIRGADLDSFADTYRPQGVAGQLGTAYPALVAVGKSQGTTVQAVAAQL